MTIQELQQQYGRLPQCGALASALSEAGTSVHLQGLVASSASLFFAGFATRRPSTILFILQDNDEAGYFYHDLTQVMGHDDVLFYPSSYRRAVKYGQRDTANEILRTEVLTRLSVVEEGAKETGRVTYVVTCPEALSELVVSKHKLDERTLSLRIGQTVPVSGLVKQLCDLGFQMQEYVYEPGQFALRGSILDVYSFSSEYPFRIDFFGDDIDTIRTFDVQSQLSRDKKKQVEIVPQVALTQEKTPFTHFLPSDTIVAVRDLPYVLDTIDGIYQEGFSKQVVTERLEGATEVERAEIMEELRKESQLVRPTLFKEEISRFQRVDFGSKPFGTPSVTIRFDISPQPIFHKNFTLLRETFADYVSRGYRLYVLSDSMKQLQRLRDILSAEEEEGGATPAGGAEAVTFTDVDKTLHAGFADNLQRICLFTDHQVFDRFHKYSLRSDTARAGKMALTMKELQEMEPGDFVVHVDFGIGKFAGLVRVATGGSYQEMIRILYQRGDTVDVSIHSLYKISKYRRADTGEPPRMSTLGTGAWERMKEKAKKRIKDIARDLIKLYAKRRHQCGFAFSPDNYMQHELEGSFLYEDTPDQLKATNDVKADMESQRPMDRLVCGDVGFGKTEVAVRAAFKAACDNKQVAVLVPTTVLAFQHFKTFSERLRDFPVTVEYLSRARSTKQVKDISNRLKEGRIDILIGTHKILGKALEWKDLGLLIIDEEQKFGVSTKEKLRQLKTNVDTLTMSATPIPRTLQFSLMGARDMSIIRTPPPNRHPVYTELTTFNAEVIADAINFEMSRNGQVYFVSSRISSLVDIQLVIQKHVPDARVAIGHGQMKPEELEKIILGFINYDYDVLISTTIVENGIDIPNANTIFINDAHRFGLSDIHQMRGRVGRSNRKAFCYLLAPPKSLLPEDARRRLEAVETFSELGSGFNLAMQDLDIRGAGNLLGAEQSGFMEDLGYDTYQKILNQAVTELKNEEFGHLYEEDLTQGREVRGDDFVEDCSLESDLEMYFPDNYVPGSGERMLLYRELDNISSDEDLEAYRRRLEDRFGKVPKEGVELMQVVPLRRLGRMLGCEKILLNQGRMQMQFMSNTDSPFFRSTTFSKVLHFINKHPRRCNLKETKERNMMVVANVTSVGEAVFILREIINEEVLTDA
ncbi:MAG: transcription-repair coupling factor [Prevotella sp.]|nr:transcription-repair coupling factor [Prevotella sp.]